MPSMKQCSTFQKNPFYLIGTDSACFKCFRRQLFILIRHKVHTKREVFNTSLLSAQVKNANLWVWHTTTKPGFWVWLVLTITVAEKLTPEMQELHT